MTMVEHQLAEILAGVSNIPDVHWLHGDDLCDCTFQRIGEWTNPYLGKTLRVRLCCIWGEIYKQYPQFVQDIDASYDANRHEWETEPREWDSMDMDMPAYLWYRQFAKQEGVTVSEARLLADPQNRPRKVGTARDRQPTAAQVQAAHMERLRLSGWL